MRFWLTCSAFLLFGIAFIGCTKDPLSSLPEEPQQEFPQSALVGTWEGKNYDSRQVALFNNDGSYLEIDSIYNKPYKFKGNFQIHENKIFLIQNVNGKKEKIELKIVNLTARHLSIEQNTADNGNQLFSFVRMK